MKRISTVILALALTTAALQAQWTQTSGPAGGNIRAMAALGNTILAVAFPEALYRFDPACNCWSRAGMLAAERMDVVGDVVIASTESGLQRSTDAGDSWEQVGPESNIARVEAVDGGVVYASDAAALYRSTDLGATWTQFGEEWATTGATQTSVFALAARGDVLIVTGDMRQTGFVRSTDGGESWEITAAGLPEGSAPFETGFVGDTLLAQVSDTAARRSLGIYISADSGTTWTVMNEGRSEAGGDYSAAFLFYREGSAIAASTYRGAIRLEEGRWIGTTETIVSAVVTGSDGDIYRGDFTGISRSDDGGLTWERIDQGLVSQTMTAISGKGSTVIASGGNGIYRSDDQGAGWTRVATMRAEQFAHQGSVVLARGSHHTEQGVLRSTDDGRTWGDANLGIEHPLPWISSIATTDDVAYLAFESRITIAGTEGLFEGGLYRSTDAGTSWELMTEGLPRMGDTTLGFGHVAASGENAVAIGSGRFYSTSDGGDTWAATGYQLPPFRQIRSLVAIGERFYMAIGRGVWRSDDLGATWIVVGGGEVPELVYSISSYAGNPLVATDGGGTSKGLYRLFRNSWVPVSDNDLPAGVGARVATIVDRTAYIATAYNSVFRLSLGTSNVEENREPRLATRWSPVPVRDKASVELKLERPGRLMIELFDFAGRHALSIETGTLPAGSNTVPVPVDGLGNGLYAYRISTEGVVTTGSIVVAR